MLFDILTIKFLLKYFTRPMHFFGTLGLAGTTLGGGIMVYLAPIIKIYWATTSCSSTVR